jgi:hypothetical protein
MENLEDELPIISELLEKYPFIAMVYFFFSKYSYTGYRIPRSGN